MRNDESIFVCAYYIWLCVLDKTAFGFEYPSVKLCTVLKTIVVGVFFVMISPI